MIHLKQYQESAVNELSDKFYKLLKRPGARHNLIFKAPTGAGKTVMMASLLNKLCEELPERYDLDKRKVAFVWIAPNKLYIQSYLAIKDFFAETRTLSPIFFEDVTGGGLQANEVLFVNWESINKEKNLMMRENESNKNLNSYVQHARLNDTEIVVIIDEEHMFASTKTAKRAAEVLQKIYPKIEVRVSATPSTNSDYKVVVERQDVIDEEMIKKGIILNPALDAIEQDGHTLNEILLDQALAKRAEVEQAYREIGANIRPLLLIQLPNDSNDANTTYDQQYIDFVLTKLEIAYGISVNNGRLAIWLSNRKENLDNIEEPDNMVEVLLFKQAIALGWDCPRAAVLLIFREIQSFTFTVQTVGRILRMPEQKHYPNALLNQGYVYTNLSRNVIGVVQDDISYISLNKAYRRESYQAVQLRSAYINTQIVRNRLGSAFRRTLYECAEGHWGVNLDMGDDNVYDRNRAQLAKRMINTDVQRIEVAIPENLRLSGEQETILVSEKARFAKTPSELNQMFRLFCRHHIGGFAPVDSVPVLDMAIKIFFEEYFGYGEIETVKIVLESSNQTQFVELIAHALEQYEEDLKNRANHALKDVQRYHWEVPVERVFNDLYEEKDFAQHALVPFYELSKASSPEKAFAQYLEDKKEHLHWWYKNGESAKEHFAVPYVDYLGTERLFYVDFVLLTQSGVTCLFDTKTKGSDPANAPLKHNALIDFVNERNEQGKPTVGGILIGNQSGEVTTWRYCRNKIENTTDLKGWDYFDPVMV